MLTLKSQGCGLVAGELHAQAVWAGRACGRVWGEPPARPGGSASSVIGAEKQQSDPTIRITDGPVLLLVAGGVAAGLEAWHPRCQFFLEQTARLILIPLLVLLAVRQD